MFLYVVTHVYAEVDIEDKFGAPFAEVKDVGTLVSIVVSNLYILAGVILLIVLIFGGFSIIAGSGQNNPEQAAQGKKAATMAAVGFLIIFASYWIIKIIELLTGFKILEGKLNP
ncbi:hypothetical protein CMO96_04980 [Candidatus Woesebacteria bacterium]|nr:hypothetical protein [Candidatus Woesebacteria bacterium]|tara:strand:+ start:1343 stop:1684 length:342 start_codon:yes stop_codon:yes gene_type:complete